jgi:SAM-dependent methyltransferase
MPGKFQLQSAGGSCPEIHHAALAGAAPGPNLTWLDVGCGSGSLLRMIRDRHEPARLTGVDVIDWLDNDLKGEVELVLGEAERVLSADGEKVDRIIMVETLEHLEAPWSALRAAARRLAPGGRMVVTTPNLASLRHRMELLARGQLTSFRPDNLPHLTPVLPHVVSRILGDEGIFSGRPSYAGRDVIPFLGGRRWPAASSGRLGRLTSVSVLIPADRPPAGSSSRLFPAVGS